MAQSLPPNPIVINIGAGSGTSGLAFMESRPDLHLYTIDIQKDNSPFGCLYAEEQALKGAGLWSDRVLHIHGNSLLVGNWWQTEYPDVDLVFIDGGHEYEECKGDILAWLPNLKPGGIIAIHDYKKSELYLSETDYQPDKPHPRPFPGVDAAVDELLLGKYELIKRVDSLIAFRL